MPGGRRRCQKDGLRRQSASRPCAHFGDFQAQRARSAGAPRKGWVSSSPSYGYRNPSLCAPPSMFADIRGNRQIMDRPSRLTCPFTAWECQRQHTTTIETALRHAGASGRTVGAGGRCASHGLSEPRPSKEGDARISAQDCTTDRSKPVASRGSGQTPLRPFSCLSTRTRTRLRPGCASGAKPPDRPVPLDGRPAWRHAISERSTMRQPLHETIPAPPGRWTTSVLGPDATLTASLHPCGARRRFTRLLPLGRSDCNNKER